MPKRWWRKRMMSTCHPDTREYALRDLDVRHLIADRVVTNADAIAVSAGGIYAFYPSQVPYHHVSEGAAPLGRPAPVGPITLDLAWDGPALAELCAPGASPQVLRCEEPWDRVRLAVPRIDAHAQVVVCSA